MNSELTREWRKWHNISVYETGRPPSSGQLTIVRSDHSRNAVSSRVLYDTVKAATLPRLAPGPAGHHTTSLATSGACHMTSARASDLQPSTEPQRGGAERRRPGDSRRVTATLAEAGHGPARRSYLVTPNVSRHSDGSGAGAGVAVA